jgi:hypothetical protein
MCALGLGCSSESDAPPAPPPAEPVTIVERPWAEQLAAVRAGESRTIECFSGVTTAELQELTEGCGGLEVLRIKLPEATPDDFDVLPKLDNLQHLMIDGPVDDAQLERIARCPTLQILNLPEGSFSDEGLRAIASLPLLTLLRIGSKNVTDAGLELLPSLPNLRYVHLINIPLTDNGLDAVRRIPLLESFYLDGGGCTDEGLGCLLKARPELHMHVDQLHLSGDTHDHAH